MPYDGVINCNLRRPWYCMAFVPSVAGKKIMSSCRNRRCYCSYCFHLLPLFADVCRSLYVAVLVFIVTVIVVFVAVSSHFDIAVVVAVVLTLAFIIAQFVVDVYRFSFLL